jgi:hypothetical protein
VQDTIVADFAGSRAHFNEAVMAFVYRRKYWLRQAVRQAVQQWQPQLRTPCAALHVRRSDVTLENQGRTYHNLSEYLVQAQPALQLMGLQSILLLTGE